MKQPSIQIHDAKPSKKNPNAKYQVKYVAGNGEPLAQSESLNDVKAVKTHINAMRSCVAAPDAVLRKPTDHTKDQKFAKSGFATGRTPMK